MKTPLIFRAGRKVNLRPLLKKDLPLLIRWINDPEVNQYLATDFPMLEKDEEKWLDRMSEQKQNNVVLMLTTKGGKAIGTMGIHQINWINGTATTGAMIGEKEYWGKGYGSEAKMLLLDYAFNRLGLRKICSNVLAFMGVANVTAKSVATKKRLVGRHSSLGTAASTTKYGLPCFERTGCLSGKSIKRQAVCETYPATKSCCWVSYPSLRAKPPPLGGPFKMIYFPT